MRVTITYYAPVIVTVDTDTETVESVHVDDEAVRAVANLHNETGEPIAVRDAQGALDIAEREPWPAWEVGM